MVRQSSATLVVALVLLGCYAGNLVVAQKGAPPQNPQPPKMPTWQAPAPPQDPQPPKMPTWPAPAPPQNPQPPKMPTWQAPAPPQNPQPPKMPTWQAPAPPQNPQPPKMPTWQAPAPPQNPQPPKRPTWPVPAPPQDPQPPKMPTWQAPAPPQDPQPPKMPTWPAIAPPQDPQPPKRPTWPAPAPPQDPRPPKRPTWQAPAPPQNPQPPKRPSWPPQNPSPQVQWDAAQESKVAQVPQQPMPLPAAPPQSCDVAIGQRVPCGGPDISAGACNAIHCCSDNNGCYYGKAVTVQCTKDAHFIVVVARDSTLPNIDLESIALLGSGPGCTHVDSNSLFAIYHFPVTACGSVVMEEPGVIIYENRMFSSYEVDVGPLGSITRDSSYELLFQCRYLGTSVETLKVEVMKLGDPLTPDPVLGPIKVELRLANGQCETKGCDEVDAAYTSYYEDSDYPVVKVLRQRVFIELRLLDKTDPNLVLTLGRCWTTTSPNPHSMPQWEICVDGCPYQGDRYLSSLIHVGESSGLQFPSHYKRLMFQMFTFVEPNAMTPLREQVYIHCSTSVCTPGQGESCQANCSRRKQRDAPVTTVKKETWLVATIGPLVMSGPTEAN